MNAPTASTALTVSIAEAQSRFIEFALLVDPLCEGIGPQLSDPVKQAFAAGQCETALTATAGMIRASSWPDEARNQAAALASAIDKHIAFLQRLDAATPAERQRLVGVTYKDLTKSSWMITHGAAGAMRKAIKLGGSSSNLL